MKCEFACSEIVDSNLNALWSESAAVMVMALVCSSNYCNDSLDSLTSRFA